ncbi:MAG TPA: hypothetical protein EYQ14_25675 [Gammaproteobacteria bacterium]|nr:hypothetical protein [Gammaproteobacteria bacterium]HIL97439.1 hypothetical protein [Pseudomonadales bacterium]
MKNLLLLTALGLGISGMVSPLQASTVLYHNATIVVDEVLPDPNDLWVKPSDLTRVNGFVLKPEGACLDDICVPVLQDEDSSLYVKRGGKSWFNVSELARKLSQAYVFDYNANVWSFGAIPVTRQSFTRDHMAPDFSILDRQGKPVRLSEYKDMKVLLLTWASW